MVPPATPGHRLCVCEVRVSFSQRLKKKFRFYSLSPLSALRVVRDACWLPPMNPTAAQRTHYRLGGISADWRFLPAHRHAPRAAAGGDGAGRGGGRRRPGSAPVDLDRRIQALARRATAGDGRVARRRGPFRSRDRRPRGMKTDAETIEILGRNAAKRRHRVHVARTRKSQGESKAPPRQVRNSLQEFLLQQIENEEMWRCAWTGEISTAESPSFHNRSRAARQPAGRAARRASIVRL